MTSTFAEGEFWSKKSTIPSGIDECVLDLSLNASSNLESSCDMLASINVLDKPSVNCLIFTFSDFKLHKEENSTFNKSGTTERT